jgi:hypothetical protein
MNKLLIIYTELHGSYLHFFGTKAADGVGIPEKVKKEIGEVLANCLRPEIDSVRYTSATWLSVQ